MDPIFSMKFASAVLLALSAVSTALAASFTNPLRAKDGSDPFIVYSGDGYYYLLTTEWTNIQVTRSKTLGGLKTGETKVVWQDSTASRCCNVWAPEVHWINNAWYIYYSASNKDNLGTQRIHVLKGGSAIFDTYAYAGQLFNEWSIDGTVLRFSDKNYFVYSCQRTNLQSLCIAPMNSPTSVGTPKTLSQPTLAWEKIGEFPVNEGPAALYHGGKTFLTYSASYCWTSSYQLGLLTYKGSGDPTLSASWTKSGPVFSSANGNYGTGHNGFFNSPDGKEVWNVYHATANSAGACDGNRYTEAQRVDWNSDGSPNFGKAVKLGTTLNGPSGE
ncbi:Arabinanase/levansucrase/invertase [Aureobasidium pullulans]|nr:Arabinanase/levansucrase/invertase [Aureobasidium pullulans]